MVPLAVQCEGWMATRLRVIRAKFKDDTSPEDEAERVNPNADRLDLGTTDGRVRIPEP